MDKFFDFNELFPRLEKDARAELSIKFIELGISNYQKTKILQYIKNIIKFLYSKHLLYYEPLLLISSLHHFPKFDKTINNIIKQFQFDIVNVKDEIWLKFIRNELTNFFSEIEIQKFEKGEVKFHISNVPSDLLINMPEIQKIIDKALQKIYDYADKNHIKPTMNNFDKNLDLFFKILKISNKQKECNLLKFNMCIPIMKEILDTFDKPLNTSYSACLGIKYDIKENSIFTTDNMFVLTEIFCSKEFKNEKDLMNTLCPVIKPNDLTLNDFYFIKQKDIIINIIKNAVKTKAKGINILFYGAPGTGKTEFAKTIINNLDNTIGYEITIRKNQNVNIYNSNYVDDYDKPRRLSETCSNEDSDIRKSKLLYTQKIVKQGKSVILFDEAEDFFRNNVFEKSKQSKLIVNEILENNENPVIWTTNDLCCMEESYLRRFNYILEFPEIPSKQLENIIQKLANKRKINLSEKTKNLIISRRPNLGIIDKSFQTYNLCKSNKEEDLNMIITDMTNNTSFQSKPKVKINKSEFLPELLNTSENLDEIADKIIKSGQLDFSILSYGCSGASKTSFARYLAEKLGIDVIYKNYSELSSCWVGETEKALQGLFDKASQEKSMIILDEADVLLMDRSKARNSWEKSQTEALLTAMEDHEYPFIMTTNLFEDLDSACMRRFDFKIKHDYLKEEQVKLALKHFFNIDLKYNSHLTKITPGDFVSVKKQIRFLPKLSEKEILEKLEQECKNKKDYRKKIGF